MTQNVFMFLGDRCGLGSRVRAGYRRGTGAGMVLGGHLSVFLSLVNVPCLFDCAFVLARLEFIL